MLERTTAPASSTTNTSVPRYFQIAAWAVPVLVVGQFSMIAIAPVLVLLTAPFVDKRAAEFRWWTVALAGVYAIPLAIMKLRTDPAQSLSKDMHPVLLVTIVVVGSALLLRMHLRNKRSTRSA